MCCQVIRRVKCCNCTCFDDIFRRQTPPALLGQKSHIKFYNDSKATNILATQKALSGFSNGKAWLLAGGLDRGNGFDELAVDVADLKGMVVFGETASKLRALAESLEISQVFDSENVAKQRVLLMTKLSQAIQFF